MRRRRGRKRRKFGYEGVGREIEQRGERGARVVKQPQTPQRPFIKIGVVEGAG